MNVWKITFDVVNLSFNDCTKKSDTLQKKPITDLKE